MHLDIIYIQIHRKNYVYRKPKRVIIWDEGSITKRKPFSPKQIKIGKTFQTVKNVFSSVPQKQLFIWIYGANLPGLKVEACDSLSSLVHLGSWSHNAWSWSSQATEIKSVSSSHGWPAGLILSSPLIESWVMRVTTHESRLTATNPIALLLPQRSTIQHPSATRTSVIQHFNSFIHTFPKFMHV